VHLNTPLLRTASHYTASNKAVWLKMDTLQPSGSFKLRGVARLCTHEIAQGAKAIVCASGGNAGFAAAYAGQQLGVPVTIVVPETTSIEVQQRIAAMGAQVMVNGGVWDEAHAFAVDYATRQQAAYVHPFDHPLLWDGHATLVDEVVAAQVGFDCVVTSVGGGGLLSGIIEGLHRNGRQDAPVIAVETLGAESLHKSLAAGALITLPAVTSVAGSLGAKRVCQRVFELAQSHRVISVTVTDAQAVAACLKFANTYRVLVEPACGAALAALDVHPQLFERFSAPLVEVCGGIGVSIDKLNAWKLRFKL
jgi:L-serine/L-threonine ammonia-lyase